MITKISSEYQAFKTLCKNLRIMCDGEAHIVSAHLLTGESLSELTNIWDKIVTGNPELFDQYKGMKAEKELEDTPKFQRQMNSLVDRMNVQIDFKEVGKEPDSAYKTFITDLDKRAGTANLTVKIMDEKPHGHVVTIWKHSGKYFLHDPNLEIQEVTPTQIQQIFTDQAELAAGYSLAYDYEFPVERVFLLN